MASRLDEVFAAEQALAAQRLTLIAEIDGRGLAAREGATSTAVWLRHRLHLDTGAARQMLALAQALDKTLPATAQALADGQLHVEQAHVIHKTITDLPDHLDPSQRAAAEQTLTGYATQFSPAQLKVLGTRILEHIAPELAEQHEREQLQRGEARAWRDRAFTLSPHGPGRMRLSGCLDTESAATVSAAIESLCSPAGAKTTAGHDTDAHPSDATPADATASDATPSDATASDATPSDATASAEASDERTPAQRRADALVEVCRMALAGGDLPTHGGARPQVVVMMPFQPWHDATAQALGQLDNGQKVTPETLRRMACDCDVIPIVLGGDGQPLDVGRMRRLVTPAIRKALNVHDRGCSFPGCDRPVSWCECHHAVPWHDGGPTSVNSMILACRPHHRLLHQGDWQVQFGPDGLPEFIPPSYVDPLQRPRRNQYWRRT